MRSHLQGIKGNGVLAKHISEHHPGDTDDPAEKFRMTIHKRSKTILDRLVTEGTRISNLDHNYPNLLMNSKSEWGKGKLVRYEPTVTRI